MQRTLSHFQILQSNPSIAAPQQKGPYSAQFPPHWIAWGKQRIPLVRLSRFRAVTPGPTNLSSHGSNQISEQQTVRATMIWFVYQTKFNPYAPCIKTTGTVMRKRRKLRSLIYITADCKLLHILFLHKGVSVLRCHPQTCRKIPGHSKRSCFGMLSAVSYLEFNVIPD